jgi:hypothetical protein
MRAVEVQGLIALQDWAAVGKAVAEEAVSAATLRSVVGGYRQLADEGNERAREILGRLEEAGVTVGLRRGGPRATRIAFDEPLTRKVQVVENKKTGHRAYFVSGLSLKPFVDTEKGVKALPDDLLVQVTYRRNGRIEIGW